MSDDLPGLPGLHDLPGRAPTEADIRSALGELRTRRARRRRQIAALVTAAVLPLGVGFTVYAAGESPTDRVVPAATPSTSTTRTAPTTSPRVVASPTPTPPARTSNCLSATLGMREITPTRLQSPSPTVTSPSSSRSGSPTATPSSPSPSPSPEC